MSDVYDGVRVVIFFYVYLVEFRGTVGAEVLYLKRYRVLRMLEDEVIGESTSFVKTGGNPPNTQQFCQNHMCGL